MVATAPVTVEQAAAILGISASTVRRRIRAGSLRAEEARRPQGPVWLVYVPEDVFPGASQASPATGPVATAPTAPTDAMVTWAASLLVPIAAELGEARQTIERQAETIRDQAERLGSLTEQVGYREHELARSSVEIATLSNELHVVEVSRWRYARSLTLAVAVLVVGAVVAGMLAAPVWVR